MVCLPKGHQQKHFIISGSYLKDGYFDYSKSREIEKRTKLCLPDSIGLFVRVRVGVTTTQLPDI